jgi:hypothetical protein
MPLPKHFYDQTGEARSLDTLCMKEPAWAANRIRVLYAELDKALELLQNKVAFSKALNNIVFPSKSEIGIYQNEE